MLAGLQIPSVIAESTLRSMKELFGDFEECFVNNAHPPRVEFFDRCTVSIFSVKIIFFLKETK